MFALASVLLLSVAPRAWAIPSGALNDPLYAKGYLVVYPHYSGVYNNGSNPGPTTTGLQTAINDAYANDLVLYLPAGTYAINNTLKAYTNTANNPVQSNHLAIVGATTGARPVIKAHSSSTVFNDAGNPKVLLEFKNFDTDDFSNPNNEKPSAGFFQMLRDVNIDCGGKAGAIGLYFNQAQDSSIENVKVIATGAHTGILGLPSRAWGAVNIEVEGGQFGIDTTPTAGGSFSKANVGSTIAGLKLTDQDVAAIVHPGQALTIVGFEITTKAGKTTPAIKVGGSTNSSAHAACLTMIDGWIQTLATFNGGVVISNPGSRTIYLRNIYVHGSNSTNLVQTGSLGVITGSGTFKRIDEYSFCNQGSAGAVGRETWDLINGAADRTPPSKNNGEVVTVTSNLGSKPSDFITRHVWGRLPSVTDADAYDPVAAGDFALTGGSVNLPAATLQGILNAHPKVFLPKGVYKLQGTVTLKTNTVLFGAARHLTRIEVDTNVWKPTAETPVLITSNSATATTYVGDLAIGVPSSVLANDYFTALNWQAGRNSMVHIARPYHNPQSSGEGTNPHSLFKILNNGGGRWYFLGRGQNRAMVDTGYRILRVSATSEPLWIYGLNMEHAGGSKYAEFTSANNVRIYGVKTEYLGETGGTPTYDCTFVSFNDCKNVALFGHAAVRHSPDAGFSLFEFKGTSTSTANNALAAVIVPQENTASANPGNSLTETIGGVTASLGWPKGVGLYKRGAIDDSVMTHANTSY